MKKDESRIRFIHKHYPEILTVSPEACADYVRANSDHGGADVVLEVAGAESTFRLAWECARPNAVVTVVALYDKAQTLPLPDMYGENLTFKCFGYRKTFSLQYPGHDSGSPCFPRSPFLHAAYSVQYWEVFV